MPTSILPTRWTDKQVPERDQIFLDHVGSFVGDLDRAAVALKRLGFAPSGISHQKNVAADGTVLLSGTSNRLVRLRRGFLEFLASTSDTPLSVQLRSALARYEGLHLIAFSHENLEAQRARLVKCGFDMQEIVRLRGRTRDVDLRHEVAWTILRTMPHVMPEGRIQFVYPHTPEWSWPPGSTDHPGVAPKLIIINELWDDAWARHLWDRTPVFDTFARAETTRDRIGGFGRASVASEWLARHAAPIACRSV